MSSWTILPDRNRAAMSYLSELDCSQILILGIFDGAGSDLESYSVQLGLKLENGRLFVNFLN